MKFLAFMLAGAIGFCVAAEARDIIPAEEGILPYTGLLPACDTPEVLARIAGRFQDRESRFWNSSLLIDGYEDVRATAWRPWGGDTIPRRFCSATAVVSDGRKHRVDYSVREDLAFIATGWDVQWCIAGLDRNSAYQPECRMARP